MGFNGDVNQIFVWIYEIYLDVLEYDGCMTEHALWLFNIAMV